MLPLKFNFSLKVFLKLIKETSFPIPKKQLKINLDNGSYTVADFAYPEKKVLIYIDGLSRNIHGNPEQRRKDRLLRAMAKAKGYQIIEISCQDLDDDIVMNMILEELAILIR